MGLNERWATGLTALPDAASTTRGGGHDTATGWRARPSSAPVRRGATMGPAPPPAERRGEWKVNARVDRARYWADVEKVAFRDCRYDDGESSGTPHAPTRVSSHLESRPKAAQDWILQTLQGGRAYPRAACAVATLCCSPPALLAQTENP
jgi:hypothetical protein